MDTVTQIHNTTPEQITKEISKIIKFEIEKLKKDFQPKEPIEYLTRNEVRDLLKVDLSTIHHYCKKGKLKPHKLGSKIYFKRNEVDQAITPANE